MSANYDPEKVLRLLDDINRYVLNCPNMRNWEHSVLDRAIAAALDEQTCHVLRLHGKGHLLGDEPGKQPPAAAKPVRWLVSWDFSGRPLSTFYSVLDEVIADGGASYIQKSVYLARDAEIAQELVALCRWYGAGEIKAVPIGEGHLDDFADKKKAERRIQDLHVERLHRRGRKKRKVFTRK